MISTHTTSNYEHELYHHGIPGMKWGVRRYQNSDGTLTSTGKQRYSSGGTKNTMRWGVRRAEHKTNQNARLQKKASRYDIKSTKAGKKSEQIHSAKDLNRANKAAKKAAKFSVKADKLRSKADATTNELKKSILVKRSAKADFKSATKTIQANRISKTAGYGAKAMRYSVKSDKLARKAAKARLKIATNDVYITKMNQKMSAISQSEVSIGRRYVDDVIGRTSA